MSPHNDDESLFGAFTLLRHRPHVIVCTRSKKQATQVPEVTWTVREAETAAAMEVLGCSWENWPTWDMRPDLAVPTMRMWLSEWKTVERVFAPAVERDGHPHHNLIGWLADDVFGPDRVTHYLTYTPAGKSVIGLPVRYEPEWVLLKLRALACYRSQIVHPELGCYPHFLRDQTEFYAG